MVKVFKACPFAFNLLSDSSYVVNAVNILETAGPIKHNSSVGPDFRNLQDLIWARTEKFYVQHIRAHSGLPGPLTKGNALADSLTRVPLIFFASAIEQAQKFHELFHVPAKTLQHRFHILRDTACKIILDCPRCVIHLHPPSLGVNPRGLMPLHTWQMDVTHIPEFGTLKYVHVSVDTYSGVIHATPMTGEKACHVITHCLEAWAAWGKTPFSEDR